MHENIFTYDYVFESDKASDHLPAGRQRLYETKKYVEENKADYLLIYPKNMVDDNKDNFSIYLFEKTRITKVIFPKNEHSGYTIIKYNVNDIKKSTIKNESGEFRADIELKDGEKLVFNSIEDTIPDFYRQDYKKAIYEIFNLY